MDLTFDFGFILSRKQNQQIPERNNGLNTNTSLTGKKPVNGNFKEGQFVSKFQLKIVKFLCYCLVLTVKREDSEAVLCHSLTSPDWGCGLSQLISFLFTIEIYFFNFLFFPGIKFASGLLDFAQPREPNKGHPGALL